MLDLFAGSGALGIEALSRGAASAVFVDSSRKAITAVRANLEALGIDADVRPIAARAALRGIRPDVRHTIWSSSIPRIGSPPSSGA